MNRKLCIALGALAIVCASGVSRAQEAAPNSASPPPEEVTVTAQQTREAIRAFTRSITIAPRTTGRLARWDRQICPGILGMRPRDAQFVLDRIAYRALQVGLEVGAPHCMANALIIVTREPDEAAHILAENYGRELGYYHDDPGARAQGREAFARFQASDAPVRWWHVSRTMSQDGHTVQGQNVVFAATRLASPVRQDFGLVLLIVDARQLSSVHGDIGALADYLAMASLAQLDPEMDTAAYDTILNLFSPAAADARPTSLSDWDAAYLQGLYGATRESVGFRQQQAEIADTMADQVIPH